MPRFSKEASKKLIKYVKTVKASFYPFDGSATSTRTFMMNIKTKEKANPKFVVEPNITQMPIPPTVDIKFIDGSELNFDGHDYNAEEMMDHLLVHAREIDFEYEVGGKSVE
mmetsp:Transcript_13057/g.26078  ORF Transcript_13057/g.26078 Transcript_13057/m.26078 type:complete len:111 (+) Transcript_13057:47-379(+)|eukprot:CAMPEP_0194319348 /NCGR_PEP_ID=MMETSP0171-20130528/15807_1 /TAXON_ID=218684 /ORGANISM="Corethron pennatum, Strain L29A3" /LENGTH=110 /DNA_ID=CAMNT_0039076531 /DNA_START=47 /DNA_END=379 /DNA_ORIENTATION=-